MPSNDVRKTVHLDSAKLRALAHPLRLRLLGALRFQGPATATELARLLDSNSGQTSYHLRKLADAGLIEDDPVHSTARDRYWKASHEGTSWSSVEFQDDPDDQAADTLLVGQVVRVHTRWLDEAVSARESWSPEWLEAARTSDWGLRLTPAQLGAMAEEVSAVVDRYDLEEATDSPEAERVTIMFHAFPHPDPSL